MHPLSRWILLCFFALLKGCAFDESARPATALPVMTILPMNLPSSTALAECQSPAIAAHLQAPAQIIAGQTFTLTFTLTNQGCGLIGIPKYTLQFTRLDPGATLLPENPAPQTHSLGLSANQSDRAEFSLQATAPGKIQIGANVGFEFHLIYPGPAKWLSAAVEPIVIHILPASSSQP